MKLVSVLGSPRPDGNSSLAARRIAELARARGAQVQEFLLNAMHIRGCQACSLCKQVGHCVVQDDLRYVLRAVEECDVLVMASPVYFGEVSAQLKCFIDRTFSFLNDDFTSRLSGGRKLVFILAQGNDSISAYEDVFVRYGAWFKRYGFAEEYRLIIPGMRAAGDVLTRAPVLKEIDRVFKAIDQA